MADTTRTVKVKFDGDAKGLARASKEGEREVDKFTKSVDKKYRKSGDDSGKGFFTSLKKWFSPKEFKKVGDEGGKVLGDGLTGALKTPVIGPAIAAGLVGAVAVAAPAVGAIAASGIALAFGAGIAGLGIVFAAKSPAVRNAWSKTLKGMSDDLTLLSKPFDSTLIHLAGTASKTFAGFKPELDHAFKELAPAVSDFGDQVAAGIGKLQPAVRPLSEAAAAVLKSFGPSLQGLLGKTSDSLTKLSASVKEAPDGLSDLVDGAGDLVSTTLNLVTSLNDANKEIEQITGGASGVDLVMGALNGTLTGTKLVLDGVTSGLGLVAKLTKPVGDGFHETATSADEAAKFSSYLTQGLDKNQLALMGITGAAPKTGAQVESLTTKYNRQKAATDTLISSMFRLQNLALGLAGAEINYQAAVDGASASIKENGRTLNDNTAKGRANHSALLEVASAANQQTQSMIQSNKGLAAATKSATTARSNFSTLAQKMGLSKKEADKLADSLIALPPKKTVTVSTPGAKGSKSDVDSLGRSIANLPSRRTIQIVTQRRDVKVADPRLGVPGRASGGTTQPKRQYLFGERGPEIGEFGTLTGPPKILSAERTRMELNRQDQPIVVENHIEIGGEVVRVVRSEIKQSNRELKRTVMAGAR